MEMEFGKGTIKFSRELSSLDKLVIRFTRILDMHGIDYVIISGYIPILFGRSRNTEDIDMFIEKMPFERFAALWKALNGKGFECINEKDPQEAYNSYLKDGLAPRFAAKGTFIPNFEIKFPGTKYNRYSLEHKVEVILNNERLNISELEMQIAFKLKLGSEKDLEDARHLYDIFKDNLDMDLLRRQVSELGAEAHAERILWKRD